MNHSKFIFDDDYCCEISVSQQQNTVSLYLMDYLSIVDNFPNIKEDDLRFVQDFLDKSNIWYKKVTQEIHFRTNQNDEISLISIYVLSEQKDGSSIFGLEFHSLHDVEHGIGLQIDSGDMNILKFGSADLAFTPPQYL